MRIAAAAYPLDPLTSWDAYVEKLTRWVADAKGADLLVFPEYGSMELAMLDGPEVAGELEASIEAVSKRLPEIDALHDELARANGVHILAASAPAATDGRPVNRARLFGPNGPIGAQDKLIMTRFERETWDIAPGTEASVFQTALGGIGIVICYDSEFPLIARAMVAAGAEILLVPSCTDTPHGYNRVRIGAMARALENQCIVVQSPTVGEAPWSPAVDENVGAAAVYGPPDLGFPPNGVLAEGAMNAPGWVFADVSLDRVGKVRAEGHVLNHAHWSEQDTRLDDVRVVAAPARANAAG